jgi:hypothetical protein
MMTAAFYMAGRSAEPTDKLNRLVRYASPHWPKCLRWIAVRPSGPTAVEPLVELIASNMFTSKKGEKLLSSL